MVQVLSKEEFTELSNYRGEHCITILLPTHRSGTEVNQRQDPILLKNALQLLTLKLRDRGLPSQAVDHLLQPGLDLYDNEVFWNNQLQGLAIFLAADFCKVFQLPYPLTEEVHLNSSFLVSPLLPALNNSEAFYLLTLSKHDARFYQGNGFGLQRLEVAGLPNGMDDVVHFEEKEGQQLFRQGGKGGTGSANFHGHSQGQLDEKENLAIYFREVDKTLYAEILHDQNAPLVLAGVAYLIPIYKQVSKYNYIVEEVITGNQDHENPNELFEKARVLVAPLFEQRVKDALQNYYNQIATALTSSMPEKVVPASHYAQVAYLFICKDEHVWGRFNETDGKVTIHTEKQEGDECLLNLAAVKTIANGGSVYLLDKERMPKDSIIAASLRF